MRLRKLCCYYCICGYIKKKKPLKVYCSAISNYVDPNGEPDNAYILIKREDYITLAKHFFELGLQARTNKELVEEVYSHIDSIKDTADRMTSGNFMHNRAAIKFSANTIAKVLELMGLKAQEGE